MATPWDDPKLYNKALADLADSRQVSSHVEDMLSSMKRIYPSNYPGFLQKDWVARSFLSQIAPTNEDFLNQSVTKPQLETQLRFNKANEEIMRAAAALYQPDSPKPPRPLPSSVPPVIQKVISKLLPGSVAFDLLTHSGDLNKGEQEQLGPQYSNRPAYEEELNRLLNTGMKFPPN